MSNSNKKTTKNVIHFKRATPPVLVPVLSDAKKVDESKIDSLKQDNHKMDNLQTAPLYSLVEPRCKILIRNALLEALGDKDEVMINQLKMRQKIRVAYQTWLNHISVLRKCEFELIRQPHGTILRKRK